MSVKVSLSTASIKASPSTAMVQPIDHDRRLEALVRDHYAFVWRILRRFGLPEGEADDAAQRVFMIVDARLDDILPGSERAFLFRTGMHVASKVHRSVRRRREEPEDQITGLAGSEPLPDDLLDQRRARALLDRILGELPTDLQAVLVLFEIEELSTAEIAEALSIPAGTVASRLRRARAELEERVARYQARSRFKGGPP
jgi:RNA polymerase sigma-70 factor, ECF subfamily